MYVWWSWMDILCYVSMFTFVLNETERKPPNSLTLTHMYNRIHVHGIDIQMECMRWNVHTNICKWMMVQTKYLMARWWCSNTVCKYLCWMCILNQYTWIYEVHGWYMRVCTYVYIHAYINDVNIDIRLHMCACVKARQSVREKEGVGVRRRGRQIARQLEREIIFEL